MQQKIDLKIRTCTDGIYMKFGIPPISLNEYKKMHHGAIKRVKQNCRSILDVLLLQIIEPSRFKLTEDGIQLLSPLFDKAEITWGLAFKEKRYRDIANYTQKIVQDALVDSGIFKDDNYTIVTGDHVAFCKEYKEEAIHIFIRGVGNYPESSGLLSDLKQELFDLYIFQEDDGC